MKHESDPVTSRLTRAPRQRWRPPSKQSSISAIGGLAAAIGAAWRVQVNMQHHVPPATAGDISNAILIGGLVTFLVAAGAVWLVWWAIARAIRRFSRTGSREVAPSGQDVHDGYDGDGEVAAIGQDVYAGYDGDGEVAAIGQDVYAGYDGEVAATMPTLIRGQRGRGKRGTGRR